jgi:4-alpha-glucanotransferase
MDYTEGAPGIGISGGFRITLPDVAMMFIPEQDCTVNEQKVFQDYHEYYKDTGGIKPQIQPTTEEQKAAKITQLDRACTDAIFEGFYSDADGEMKFYGFEKQDQDNLTAYLTGINAGLQTTVLWKEKGGFPKSYTIDQFKKLYSDGFDVHLKSQWVRFHELKAQILTCEDDSWMDIVWPV